MNFKHLFYFWKVATSGGVLRAAEQLHTTPQTLSGQIKLLEEQLGKPLFRKAGRTLALTEAGELALDYAGEIFSLGNELEDMLANDSAAGQSMEFRVGVADALPNAIVQRLLMPVLALDTPVHLICREWRIDRLLSELAVHRLDLVLTDSPVPSGYSIKAFSHRLGASPMAFFAAPALAARCAEKPFPQCLHGAPMLLLSEDSAVRRQCEELVRSWQIRPRVVAEFDDSGLMKAFGREGHGIFMAPSVLSAETCNQFGVQEIGRTQEIEQAYYAITVQKRITHPCTEAIARTAREGLFTLGQPG
ncbi:transcriptional activator NhaR [Uliginosibacterium sp. 31-16]|uniref:transcriptional activator NhaR n=1 Tax=Uliginosibacterium sp. 31-16 TaxID=3068315 RepID=UPI00273ED34D|nr:transcriptional activator NhaR [Uliginosibacterium sp. 31-16]MDP5240340.1 transcriptional activator NhaR [Uliginosibacterium sp. 31-16]